MSTTPKENVTKTAAPRKPTPDRSRRAALSKPRARRRVAIPDDAPKTATVATDTNVVALPTANTTRSRIADQDLPAPACDDLEAADLVTGGLPVEEATVAPEIADAFALFRSSQIASRSSRVALAMASLMRIRLAYPRQIEALAELEELRLLGLEMRGQQQLGLTIFERTGCGKSTIAEQYKAMLKASAPPGKHPVIHARLGVSGSARDLWVAVMSELGDGFATSGTEHTLRRRAIRAMEDAGVQLLIIDEAHHGGTKSGFAREITAELKIMLDTGLVPIVLLGTEEAVPIIAQDRELSVRLFSPCRLGQLNWADDDDRDLWTGFLDELDQRMVKDGIVSRSSGLADDEIAEALCEICDGVIGQLMRIMLMALREVVREGREMIEIDDLAYAVDQWSLGLGFTIDNPLHDL